MAIPWMLGDFKVPLTCETHLKTSFLINKCLLLAAEKIREGKYSISTLKLLKINEETFPLYIATDIDKEISQTDMYNGLSVHIIVSEYFHP